MKYLKILLFNIFSFDKKKIIKTFINKNDNIYINKLVLKNKLS